MGTYLEDKYGLTTAYAQVNNASGVTGETANAAGIASALAQLAFLKNDAAVDKADAAKLSQIARLAQQIERDLIEKNEELDSSAWLIDLNLVDLDLDLNGNFNALKLNYTEAGSSSVVFAATAVASRTRMTIAARCPSLVVPAPPR